MIFAVLCTGPSMSQAVANSVRDLNVIAVNGAYQFAPWAKALAASDSKWWACNPEAMKFTGRKFTAMNIPGIERVSPGTFGTGRCSGVLALEVAKLLGAKQILLLGADFKGGHFFGDYQKPLKNTTDERREVHRKQFRSWRDANVRISVINCTPGSGLDCFVKLPMEAALREVA